MNKSVWDEIDKIIESLTPEEKEKWAKVGIAWTEVLWTRAMNELNKEKNNGK